MATNYLATVKYNMNGGSGLIFPTFIGSETSSCTGNLSSSRPSRDGYTFRGWSTSSSATSPSYQPGQSVTLTGGTTLVLYAVWQKIYRTVTFNANGGTGTVPSQISHWIKSSVEIPQCTLTKPLQNFIGWSTSASATSPSYSAGGKYTFTSNVTLYAVWGPKRTVPTINTNFLTLTQPTVITTTASNSAFRHTLKLQFKNQEITIATNVASSYTYTPPASLAQYYTDSNMCAAVIKCTTYDAQGQELGTEILSTALDNGALSEQSGYIPKVTFSYYNSPEWTTAFVNQFGPVCIEKKTTLRVNYTVDTSGSYGGTVSKLECNFDGRIYQCGTTSGSITLNAPLNHGTLDLTFYLIDSRGNRYTSSPTHILVYAWDSPIAAFKENPRRGAPETQVSCKYRWQISPVDNLNTKQIVIRYKEETASSWTSISIVPDTYSGEATYTFSASFDAEKYYDFEIYGTDFFGAGSSYSTLLNTQGDIEIDISYTDGTIGFHHESPSDGYDHYYEHELHFDEKKIKVLGYDMVKDAGDSVTLYVNGTAIPNSSKKWTFLVPLTVPLHGTLTVTGGTVNVYKYDGTAVFSSFTFLDSANAGSASSTSFIVESISQYVNGLKVVCRNNTTTLPSSVSANQTCSIFGELKLRLSS